MQESEKTKGTVLVIEDDLDFSEFLTTVLNDHGYRTETVMDGDKALERAKALRPDGITLDVLLPGRTGIALYRKFRRDPDTRDIPIVIVSGVGTEGKKLNIERFFSQRSIKAPEGVLQKPVEPEVLLRTVDEALARAAGAAVKSA